MCVCVCVHVCSACVGRGGGGGAWHYTPHRAQGELVFVCVRRERGSVQAQIIRNDSQLEEFAMS